MTDAAARIMAVAVDAPTEKADDDVVVAVVVVVSLSFPAFSA
jgi:hypothetical protein